MMKMMLEKRAGDEEVGDEVEGWYDLLFLRTLKPMSDASRWRKKSRDEDDEDENGGVICEVEMGVEGEAEESVVEIEKNNERKDRPHTGRGNAEKWKGKTKMF